jgi:hypothetical protein
MLGATTFSENAIADQGILFFGVSEQSGISSSANVGVGIMSGVATMDGNFTATTAGMYISGSTNAEMSFSGLQSESTAFLVNLGVSSMESAFTETSNGIMIGSGVATTDFNMTQTSNGGLLYENIGDSTGQRPAGAPAPGAGYTEISPSGVESYLSITPSGSETWSEI